MVKLSVVVPIYNVEAYLQEALASISRQTLSDLEVIMVDDGSTDDSALIAKSFASRDRRFRLLAQENQGLGPARNTGTGHATGTYLAFFDSDDVLPAHAYNVLVGSLEKTGSDIAAGGVRRFSSGWISSSFAHGDVFRETILRTNAANHPALLRDCTAWNKVYRRSFWDSTGLTFPVGRYEDTPVTIPAYVLARSVDVLRDIVYYWRARESGDFSRNQRARELKNVEARMASVRKASDFLATHAPALKPSYDRQVLDTHLGVLVRAFEFASEAERKQLLELAAGYLGSVDESVFREADANQRLRYYLIRQRMHAELLEVLRYSRRGDAATAPLVRRGLLRRRWYIGYPYLDDPSRGIPPQVYDASREMTLNVRLDAVTWHAGKLRIEGHAYIRRVHAPRQRDTRIQVMLRNTVIRRTVRLRVKRIERPDVTARSRQAAACYDWSGFVVEIDPARLSNFGTWRAASWELRVKVRARGVRREGPVNSVAPGSATLPEGRWVTGSACLQPAPEHDGRFLIRARRPAAMVTACRADRENLQIEGWSASPLGGSAAVVVSRQQGREAAARVPAVVTPAASGRHGFRAAIPVTLLASGAAARDAGDQGPQDDTGEPLLPVGDEVFWDFALDPGTRHAVRLGGVPETAGTRLSTGGREITTFLTPYGNLSAIDRACRLVVRQAFWAADDRLVLSGDCTDTHTVPKVIVLRGAGSQHAVPLQWQDGVFSTHLSPGSMPGQGGDLPLASGKWELFAQTSAGEARVVVDRRLLTRLPTLHTTGIHQVTAETYRGDALRLAIRLGSAEHSRFAQRQLLEWYGSQVSRSHIDDLAVFDSHGARQYSCNPRAIYEELRRRDTGLRCVWITRDGQFAIPDSGRVVLYRSREHYELAARARFIVSNTLQPDWYRKPTGQVYLQTWHGTPLKRICFDVDRPQFASGESYHDRARADIAKWDALLSANAFSTHIFRKAFDFNGNILEFGYPRNDLLSSPDSAGRAAAIRRQIGLPTGQRTVLYAPTWRDDAITRAGGYGFPQHLNLDAITRALGDDHIILVRAHVNLREALVTDTTNSRIIDVTRYPDITDLLLIADVLITDYSSVMFDFAVTGRPMLFFTYDLERYRDKLRGFYFDFEKEAPGPLLCTSDDVVDALRNIEDMNRNYRVAYAAFAERFCHREDGHAAERTVDWLLSHAT